MSKVLIIGSGARENVIAEAISKSEKVQKIYLLPGNVPLNLQCETECLSFDDNNYDLIVKFCKNEEINLVIVGPENHLVNGLCDKLNKKWSGFFFSPPTDSNIIKLYDYNTFIHHHFNFNSLKPIFLRNQKLFKIKI